MVSGGIGKDTWTKGRKMARQTGFAAQRRRPRISTLIIVVLLHILALYGLAKAFAPSSVAIVEDTVVAAFTVTVTAPEPETPPEAEPKPDQGAQGDPGREAIAKPNSAPEPPIRVRKDPPAPKAASTGTASRSGGAQSGDGTGAAGQGLGTGSGNAGRGQGGIAVTKPVHISGGIDNARDYPVPEGGRDARKGTQVIVKVTVGVDGRASNCSVFRSSPDPQADRLTCDLVVERLRFDPAKNANGDPVPAPFYWRQRWF